MCNLRIHFYAVGRLVPVAIVVCVLPVFRIACLRSVYLFLDCNTYDISKLEKRNLFSLFFFVREEQRDTGFSHEQKTVKVKIRNRTIAKRTSRVCPLLGQLRHYDSTKGVSLLQLQSC